jgi:hypothetical protein
MMPGEVSVEIEVFRISQPIKMILKIEFFEFCGISSYDESSCVLEYGETYSNQ